MKMSEMQKVAFSQILSWLCQREGVINGRKIEGSKLKASKISPEDIQEAICGKKEFTSLSLERLVRLLTLDDDEFEALKAAWNNGEVFITIDLIERIRGNGNGGKPAAKPTEAMEPEILSLGDFLRRYRQKKGLTQADVSKKTGIITLYISSLESDKYKSFSADTMQRLIDKLAASIKFSSDAEKRSFLQAASRAMSAKRSQPNKRAKKIEDVAAKKEVGASRKLAPEKATLADSIPDETPIASPVVVTVLSSDDTKLGAVTQSSNDGLKETRKALGRFLEVFIQEKGGDAPATARFLDDLKNCKGILVICTR